MQPVHPLLLHGSLLDLNWPADNVPGPTFCVAAARDEEAGRSSQPQFLHLPQQTGALFPGRFVWKAAVGLQTHGGRSSTTSTRGGGSAERVVQGQGLVCGGAAGGAPAGLLVVCGAGGGSCGGGGRDGSGFSVTLVGSSVVAFALSAAEAMDGGDVMVVADVTQRHILRCSRAVRQAKEVHRGVVASPSSRPPVVGPAGADGAEVLLVTVVSPAF